MSEELTIGGYELKNCVATGATTQIWEVNEPGSATQLAMKLMLDDVRKDSAERAVLKHEFKVGKSLEHPMFLQFHHLEINRDHSFFVMDFYRSPSLKTHITSNLPAIQSSFKKLAESLAQAFHFMHTTGWLHRDIKPDNILVNRAGETRIIDFSLASRVKGAFGLMISGKQKSIQGTRTYIAPETILKKAPTPQTDMYSLGVSFFEVLTGVPPFAGDSPNALLKKHLGETVVAPSVYNPNVTKEMDRIILQLLEKDPKKRFETMQDLERALQSVQCFEQDPSELKKRQIQEAEEKQAQSLDQRLNSRADAERSAQGIAAPPPVKKKRVVDKALLEEEERRLAAEKAKKQNAGAPGQHGPGMPMQQPMQPGMYPGMPMQPGMPYPQMGYPGMGYPGMPMQQPMPGHPMPQYPMPGQQQPPPQQQQPAPGQPQAPVPAQQPQQPPAQQPQQPAQQSPQAAPATQQPPAAEPGTKDDEKQKKEEPQEATLDDIANFQIE